MTRVAALDCGTNSVRLLIADVPDDGSPLRDLARRMEIVRLGEGVDHTGALSPAAVRRTAAALAGFGEEIRRLGVSQVRMVVTSASRDAANTGEFSTLVRQTIGVTPQVVTGEEEAHLSFHGAVRGLLGTAPPPYLVVDIGGGSTELVRGTEEIGAAVSVDIGCVRITERHLRSDPPTAAQLRAAQSDIATAVDAALATVGRQKATLVGLAGSVTTVAAIALGLSQYCSDQVHHARIGYEAVKTVTAELLAMTGAQRLALPVMHPGRADVIGAGAMILQTVMSSVGAASVIVSEQDLLDGIAWSLVQR